MSRPTTLIGFAIAALSLAGVLTAQQKPAGPLVEVFKSPTCGCCENWVKHMQAAGFIVRTTDLNDLTQIKKSRGVPADVQSCHTAVVNGYVVEGHVPAADVHRLLKQKPAIAGIAVGGMPIGYMKKMCHSVGSIMRVNLDCQMRSSFRVQKVQSAT